MTTATALALAIVLAAETGVPVPLPVDIVLLALGERAAAGEIALWVAMTWLELAVVVGTIALFMIVRSAGYRVIDRLQARRPSLASRIARVRSSFERRGNIALAVGRATPGLRTITALAAGLSGIRPRVALVLLVVGGSVFVQGHVLLGYAIGPAARSLLEDLPMVGIAVIGLVAIAGLVIFLVRRRHEGVATTLEGICPACLAVRAGVRDGGTEV